MSYDDIKQGQYFSGNGSLPDSSEPLPELMLANNQWELHLRGFHLSAISYEMLKSSILDMKLNRTHLILGKSVDSSLFLVLHICVSDLGQY